MWKVCVSCKFISYHLPSDALVPLEVRGGLVEDAAPCRRGDYRPEDVLLEPDEVTQEDEV